MLQLAFYKGPATDTWHQLAHRVICWVTGSPYSHVELVIDGACCSASPRDGGVRGKRIDLASGKWDVINVPGHSEARAWDWFCRHNGHAYDYAGVLRFVLPLLPSRRNQWFCSEAVAAALGLPTADLWTPGMLADHFKGAHP
jgi:hypothetical protein